MKCACRFIASTALALVACIASAQVPQDPQPAPAASIADGSAASLQGPATHPLDNSDLAAFFDGLMPYAIRRGDIAGGVIVVVRGGKVVFAKGYGYADLERHVPVSPRTTLFRIGSISKLFTWTAVMQLVEEGKLDLNRNINDYLDFRIPPRFGKPITLRDLMTHTPGFEETTRDLLPATPSGVDLGKYLKAHVPARIFPPGKIVAYSNYGAGLAGYIVQRVSGERFPEYIRRHILAPLHMRHSTFVQPLPPALAPLLAKGYESAADPEPHPFELVNPAPAGAMTSSAMDMANFMIAQLQDGRFGDTRILRKKTAEVMHSLHYTAAPGLNGFDLGFYQENRNGQRIIGHGGDTLVFHSDLHLLLGADTGIFMSFNSEGDDGAVNTLRTAIFHAFLDRYFPYRTTPRPEPASARSDAARVAGSYESSRRNVSALSLLYLLSQDRVTALPNGTLTVSSLTGYAGHPLHWREIAPLHYRQVHGQALLDFVSNAHGRILYWATSGNPTNVNQRLPAYRSMGTFGPLVGLASAVVLATLLIWLFGAWIRRRFRHPLVLGRAQQGTRLLSRLGALAMAIVMSGWAFLIVAVSANQMLLVRGTLVPWMYLLYAFGVLALFGALAAVANAVRTWLAPRRSWLVRCGESLLALATLYLAWFIVTFGLVSFSVRF